jgi:hypothetical protein
MQKFEMRVVAKCFRRDTEAQTVGLWNSLFRSQQSDAVFDVHPQQQQRYARGHFVYHYVRFVLPPIHDRRPLRVTILVPDGASTPPL